MIGGRDIVLEHCRNPVLVKDAAIEHIGKVWKRRVVEEDPDDRDAFFIYRDPETMQDIEEHGVTKSNGKGMINLISKSGQMTLVVSEEFSAEVRQITRAIMEPQVGDAVFRGVARASWVSGQVKPTISIDYQRFTVVRRTPKGMYLNYGSPGAMAADYETVEDFERYIEMWGHTTMWRSLTGRYAFRTREDALESLKARSQWRYKHALRRYEEAGAVLSKLETAEPKDTLLRTLQWHESS